MAPSGEHNGGDGHTGRAEPVYVDIGIWFDAASGNLNLAIGSFRNAHVIISDSATSARGHPELFRVLALVLRDAGASHPPL